MNTRPTVRNSATWRGTRSDDTTSRQWLPRAREAVLARARAAAARDAARDAASPTSSPGRKRDERPLRPPSPPPRLAEELGQRVGMKASTSFSSPHRVTRPGFSMDERRSSFNSPHRSVRRTYVRDEDSPIRASAYDPPPRIRASTSFHGPPREAQLFTDGDHVLKAVSAFRSSLPRRASHATIERSHPEDEPAAALPKKAAPLSNHENDDTSSITSSQERTQHNVSVEEADSDSVRGYARPVMTRRMRSDGRRTVASRPDSDALRRLRSDQHPSLPSYSARRTSIGDARTTLRRSVDGSTELTAAPSFRALRGAATRLLPRRGTPRESAAADIRVSAENVKQQLSSMFGTSGVCAGGCACGGTSHSRALSTRAPPQRWQNTRYNTPRRAQSSSTVLDGLDMLADEHVHEMACGSTRARVDPFNDGSSTVSAARVH